MKKFLQRFVMMGFTMALLFSGVEVYGADITVDVSSYAGFVNQYNATHAPYTQLTINLTDGFRFDRNFVELNPLHTLSYLTLSGNNHTLNGDMGKGFILNQGYLSFADIVITEFNNGKNNSNTNGGAVSLSSGAYIGLSENVSFINNSVQKYVGSIQDVFGGAISVQESTLAIGGNIIEFIGNSAENFGGAIAVWTQINYANYYAQMDVYDSTISFINNSANDGGAIYAGKRARIDFSGWQNSKVDFNNNIARNNGGAIYTVEGSTVRFTHSYDMSRKDNFVGNEAGGKGGAIYVGARSDIYVYYTSMNFTGNIAKGDGGGAIFAENGYHNIQFSGSIVKFENNKSNNNGGAIFIGSTSYTPMSFKEGEVSFIGNNANNNGGAIFVGESSNYGTVLLENVTFINNTAGSNGGAIYMSNNTNIIIKATTKDVIFSGNKANGQDNDIHMRSYSTLDLNTTDKKIELNGGITGGVEWSTVTKSGVGVLVLNGKNNLPNGGFWISANGGEVKAIGQQLVFGTLYVAQDTKYSMQDDNAVQLTSVTYAYINGTLELDVDFGSGNSDKLYASNTINFNSGAKISINGYGSGYENEIIIVFGNSISGLNPDDILFSELNAIKYKTYYIGTSSISVIAKSVSSVETPTELKNEMESNNFLIEFTNPNITLNDTAIKTGVVYGNGNSIDGKGGNGLSIEQDKAVEFNDLNVKNFTENTAIAVVDGSVLTIAANSKDVSFAGNKEDLSLTKEAKVNIETRNNHNVSFGSGISGDAGSKIDKKGDGTLVLDGNVAFSGNMNIGQGVVQITAEEVFISTLVVSNGGIYSTADGKKHTTNVDKAEISGTLEIGLNADGANLIIVSSAIFVNSESVWNITPFGKGIVSGRDIELIITDGKIIGEVDEEHIYEIKSNGTTLKYQIVAFERTLGITPSNLRTGIYLRIISVLNGLGINGAFIANSIRLGALSNNGNVYANINNDVWVAGVVNGQNLKDSVNEDFKSNGYGVQAGAMIYLDENRRRTMTGGLFAGFNAKSLKEGEDKADANDIELGTYWGYKTQKVNVMGSLSGGFQSISAKNEEAKAKADFNTYSIRLGAEAEYLLGIWKPYIGIAGGYVSSGKIEEKTDGDVSGTIDADSYMRLETIAGIKIEKEVGSTLLSAKAHLGYLAVGEKPEYKAGDVTIYGTKEDPLSAGVGIGIEYAVSKKVSIFLNGDTNFGKDLFGYYGNLGGSYKF